MHWLDYLILTGLLTVSMAIGLYHAFSGGRQQTTQEFIMADRKLRIAPTVISLFVSYLSAIVALGMTAEMYYQGVQLWFGSILGFTLAILVAERVLVPWIYPLKLTSVYEYFDLRYSSKALRMFTASLGVFSSMLFMGVAMYAPSIALEIATGVPNSLSIPLMAVLCAAYTSLGGMKAVIWTDVLQFLAFIGGCFTIIIKAAIGGSGLHRTMTTAAEEGRLQWVDFSFDLTERHTFVGFLIGWTTNAVFTYGLNQASVQRYSAVETLANARWTLLLVIPVMAVSATMISVMGLQLLDIFVNIVGCDPLASGRIRHPNQILPHYVKTDFGHIKGFSGIFLATLYSGALSTVSSCLSGAATNTSRDILDNIAFFRDMSDRQATVVTRMLVLVLGALSTGIAFLAVYIPGSLTQVAQALIGSTGGPLLGMFLLGGLFKVSEWKGTLIGGTVGLTFTLWLAVGSTTIKGQYPLLPPTTVANCTPAVNLTRPFSTPVFEGVETLYTVSYLWYAPIGVIVTMVAGLFISGLINVSMSDAAREAHRSSIPDVAFIRWRDVCTFSKTSAVQQYSDESQLETFKNDDIKVESKIDDRSGPLLNQKI